MLTEEMITNVGRLSFNNESTSSCICDLPGVFLNVHLLLFLYYVASLECTALIAVGPGTFTLESERRCRRCRKHDMLSRLCEADMTRAIITIDVIAL